VILAGLTGGIGTGKSTVSAIFQKAGALIVDADQISHDVVQQGKSAWKSIVDGFGEGILLAGGEIDRIALGRIIFNDMTQKLRLDKMVHPHVFREMTNKINEIALSDPDAVVILHQNMPDTILVYAPEAVQISRLMKRDGISEVDALAKIRSQLSIEEKKKLIKIVIDNSGSVADTRTRTLAVYDYLKQKRYHRDLTWND
jgi:dephospho-CoA kinase